MNLALGADERLHIVDTVLNILEQREHSVSCYLPNQGETLPWPQIAKQVSKAVISGEADEGILLCWTGTGVSMAANKIRGIRAALCADAETARGAKLWNNANILCLSMRSTSGQVAKEIIESWFDTQYIPNQTDEACLAMIEDLDNARKIR